MKFLSKQKLFPKKKLSQYFLVDDQVLQLILETADIHSHETILEVGAGTGVLTEALLRKGGKVVAIEKDDTLAQKLQRLQNGRLTIICGDIFEYKTLSFDKVVANLPYHISTFFLQNFLPLGKPMTLLLSKETAEKCVATPKEKRKYGFLSLFCQFYASVILVSVVNRKAFYPQPKALSALVHFLPKKTFSIDAAGFLKFLKRVNI